MCHFCFQDAFLCYHTWSLKRKGTRTALEIISILQLRKGRHDEFPDLEQLRLGGGLGGKPSPTFCKGSATGPPRPPAPAGATEHLRLLGTQASQIPPPCLHGVHASTPEGLKQPNVIW